jgi:Luciferase-like monooxygenase
LLQFSRLAEQSGFDSVFISDHFQPWKHHGGHAPFSLAWLGALGALTSRIIIGTSVLTPTFRYHPAVVAQAFATLGVMFPDRIVLGVGTGESLNEVPSTGMTWPDFKERFAFPDSRQEKIVQRSNVVVHSQNESYGMSAASGSTSLRLDVPGSPCPTFPSLRR